LWEEYSVALSAQGLIDESIKASQPLPDARLVAWAVVAEWETPDRHKHLTRLASPNTAIWEFKGYLHEGLYGLWESADLARWSGNGR
jgi:hypothetical protein